MFLFAWSVFLVTVVSCRGVAASREKRAGQEFRCCTPPQWTANIRVDEASVKHGVNKYDQTWIEYLYDSTNDRIAFTKYTVNGQTVAERIVFDFRQHQLTVVLNSKNCVIYPLAADMQIACTPENISFVAFAVAPIISPMEGVYANTVYYNGTDVIDGHMTVTVGACVLIEEAMFKLNSAGSIVETLQYFNQTLSVDSSAFVIPPNCAQAVDGSLLSPPILHSLPGMRSL